MSADTTTNSIGTRPGAHLHLPAEPGYERRGAAWNRLVRHAPALVVAAQNADQVASAVRTAGALGEPVRVQATGHGALTAATGGILIDTSALNRVTVDPAAATWVPGPTSVRVTRSGRDSPLPRTRWAGSPTLDEVSTEQPAPHGGRHR
jgi:hypothetical protein